jgi:hypothetical protein
MPINTIVIFSFPKQYFLCQLFFLFAMERSMEKKAVVRPKVQKGKRKKMTRAPAPQRGTTSLRKVDAQHPPVTPCLSDDADEDYVEFLKTYKPHDGYSSGSDEIDADYAEFLRTYNPQEVYPGGVSSSGEADSSLTFNTQGKAGSSVQPKDGKR